MTAPTGAPPRAGSQLRLVVAAGAERRHVALRADVRLGDALRAAVLPVDLPGTLVLDDDGTALDLLAPAGDQLRDGAGVHLVRPAPAPSRRTTPLDDRSRRAAPQAGLLGLAGVVGLALVVVAVLPGLPWRPSGAVLAAVVVLLAGCALGLALCRAAADRAVTLAAPALAAGAGAWATLPVTAADRRLALVIALVAACVVGCVRAVAAHRDGRGADEAVVVLAALTVVALTQGGALLLGWPVAAAAALVLGACPLLLRAVPRIALAVPDDQLLDVAHVSRSAASVRAARPRPLGRVSERAVVREVTGAEVRATAAVAAVSLGAAVLAAPVLTGARPGTLASWGALALTGLVAVAFSLVPRGARGTASRWWPRLAAGALLVELALLGPVGSPTARVAVAGLTLGLALVLAAVGAALARSWRSVVASRLGDAAEALAVVLSLPAAVVAADLVETLRGMTS